MKKIAYIFLLSVFAISCASKPQSVTVTVENPSGFDRLTDMIELPISDIKAKLAASDTVNYIVVNRAGEIVPSQITSDGKLIFQANVKSEETVEYSVSVGPRQEYKVQTYGRFIKERKDDFAWENDRVAFRTYGPSLVTIDGPSNGIDLWYKRTPEMVIDKWYKDDIAGTVSYHSDNGEGLDNYSVGRSLGAGAMAPYVDHQLWLNQNFALQEVFDNGPLRTTFKLTYNDIDVNGAKFSETRIISLDAGSQLTKITQEYGTSVRMPVAAGLVKHGTSDSIIVAPDKTYVLCLEPKTDQVDGVYVAVVYPQGFNDVVEDTYNIKHEITKKDLSFSHFLGIVDYQPGRPVTYYTGYGWNKYGFTDEKDFANYLQQFVERLKQPLVINLTDKIEKN